MLVVVIIAAMCDPIAGPRENLAAIVPTSALGGWTLTVLTPLLFWLRIVPAR